MPPSPGPAATTLAPVAPLAAAGPARGPAPAGLAAPGSEPAPPPAVAPDEAVLAALPTGAAASDAAPARALDPAPPALAVRVMLHYPASARDAADTVVAALEAAGVSEVVAVPVRFEVSRTDVRFFHGSDAAAAHGIASVLGRGAGGAGPQARDFTHFSPQPASGKLEVWLAAGARS